MRHSVVDRPLIRLRWRIEDEEYIDCFNEVPFHQLEGDTKATVSARMAGSIQSTLAKYGLWPIPAASAVTCSIMDVRDAISGASTKVQHAEVNGPYVLVRDDLTIRWGDCEVTTAKEDIEYMDSKAAKTGIKKA